MTPAFEVEWRAAISVLMRCSGEALRVLRRVELFVPLLPWAALRAASALWLGQFPTPPRDRLADLWELVGGVDASSFPLSAAILPRVMAWCDPVLELAAGVMGIAVVCAMLPDVYRGVTPSAGAAWGRAIRRLVPAWIAAAPGIVGAGVLTIAADILAAAPTIGTYAHALAVGLALLCRAFFVYTIAAVVISGASPAKAWRRSVTLATQFLGPTFGLVAISCLLVLPWQTGPDLVAGQFHRILPLWTAPWVAVGAGPIVIAALFVTAAAVRLYLHGYGAGSSR